MQRIPPKLARARRPGSSTCISTGSSETSSIVHRLGTRFYLSWPCWQAYESASIKTNEHLHALSFPLVRLPLEPLINPRPDH